jgi:cation diffusion facilitator family transporter
MKPTHQAEDSSTKEGRFTVLAAIGLNGLIATSKFVVAALSGSSALLSEAIHSTVDTIDTVLLWVGQRRSTRVADDEHPFGHGKELYFWTTVVSLLVFAVGGGMSVYEGVIHLLRPQPLEDAFWSYVVLGISAVCEGTSWAIALRHFRRAQRGRGAWQTVRNTKDPLVFMVLFEDSAALLGIALAFAGVLLDHVTGEPRYDAAASVAIGLLLMAVAVLLARESRGLLVGESADPAMLADIRRVARSDAAVEQVGRALTVYFGPRTVVLNLELEFRPGIHAEEVAASVNRVEDRLRSIHPELRHIFIEARSLSGSSPSA